MSSTEAYLILSRGDLCYAHLTVRYSKKFCCLKRGVQYKLVSVVNAAAVAAVLHAKWNWTHVKTHKQSHKYTHTQLQMAHAHTQTLPGRCVHSLGDIHSRIAFRILLIRPLFLYSIPPSLRPSSVHILWHNWHSCVSAAVVIRAADSTVARRLSTRYSVTFVRNGKMPKCGKCARNETHLLPVRDYLIKYLLKNKTGAKFRMRIACRIRWAMLMPMAIYLFIFIHRNSRVVLSQYALQYCFFSLPMKILLIPLSRHAPPHGLSVSFCFQFAPKSMPRFAASRAAP